MSLSLFLDNNDSNRLPMAATFCNLNPGSGLKKLNEYLLYRSYKTRQVSFLSFTLRTLGNCYSETELLRYGSDLKT
jgi:hypothetical protein